MSDVEEELGNGEEQQLSEMSVSRRSSFVERKRQIQRETTEESEILGDHDQGVEGTRDAEVSDNQEIDTDIVGERTSAADADPDVENDAALYDEVDQDWVDSAEPQPVPTFPSGDLGAEWAAEIIEEIQQPAPDFPAPVEVEEIIDELAPAEIDLSDDRNEFELTEVTDDVEQVTSVRAKVKSSLTPPDNSASVEKVRQLTVLEERVAVKLLQVEAAEELALAAEQAKVARKEALRLREAKRHEEFVSGHSKEANGELGEGLVGDGVAASKHKQFLPHIPKRVRAGVGKDRAGQESDQEGSAPAGDLTSNAHYHDTEEDPIKAQRALRSKSLVSRARRNKVATAVGDDSVDDNSDKKSPHQQQQQLDGVGVEGNSLSRNSSQGPKPPRRKVGGVVVRPGRRVASSTTDDTETREGTHFPPLVHPRSSPDPSQYGDAEGMSSAENGENSQKGRKHRKPLFLRMIERAQQQTLDDEKQKHELYVEQKKIRQKNNPSAEELRAHRHKHDELMRAKQDEARRAMAEAAAANAKAVPVKKVAAAAVEAPAPSDFLRNPLVEAAASLPKKKKKKVAGSTSGAASRDEPNGGLDLPMQGAVRTSTEKQEKHGSHSSGSSPANKARGAADSQEGEGSVSKRSHRSPATVSEAPLQPSPVRKLNFDAAAASKAVALLPELSVEGSVSAFCSPDWLAAFARVDLDEVNNDRETGPQPSSDFGAFLKPAPPTIDAYNLMYGNNS